MQPWETLQRVAEAAVEEARAQLPDSIREAAREVPVLLEEAPGAELITEGVASDTLGLFTGDSFADEVNAGPYPTQIILYLRNLETYALGRERLFRREVRRTYLHELGHYLGWDEENLLDRGLD